MNKVTTKVKSDLKGAYKTQNEGKNICSAIIKNFSGPTYLGTGSNFKYFFQQLYQKLKLFNTLITFDSDIKL